ncbi:hypothetical protein BT96DRAFT_841979 [Gymnopus androsaceus JB14]|uniref:Uncharacterized protein n=1 Tax=Gymnopus androsaceus JB14 TaxID=1447944 RepID=A0A6A4GGF0_9AGAR|nr:hypothetical protein BT96DRAFT_841979 [Gymnopus androsaceus JB14]
MEDTSVNKTGWPAWLRDSYESLLGDGRPEGTLWTNTLNDWTTLERYYGFENPSGSVTFFGSQGRPEAVHWWSQNAKPSSHRPPEKVLGNADTFGRSWWAWWSALNPGWRERDVVTGQIIVGGADGDGDWTRFDHPGQCGLLTVLYCLLWWSGLIHTNKQRSLWTSALRDVAWVVGELLTENKYVKFHFLRMKLLILV